MASPSGLSKRPWEGAVFTNFDLYHLRTGLRNSAPKATTARTAATAIILERCDIASFYKATGFRQQASLLILVAAEVDDDLRGEDQDGILPVGDLDPVGVGPGEVFLGDRGDAASAAGEGILVIPEVALGQEIVRPGAVDRDLAVEEREHRLLDPRRE